MLTLFGFLKASISFLFGVLYIKTKFLYFLSKIFKCINIYELLGTVIDVIKHFIIFLNF